MPFNRFPARFGKYIVLDSVSAGGMAEVYRAKEATDEFSRIVAIKRMHDEVATDQTMVPMFVDEAKLASQLVHPNIAQIFELGRTDGALYIAMELVWGHDLKTIMSVSRKKKIQLPPNIACYIIAKAAEALDFAHNATGPEGKPLRLVHRDVSPQNIMVDYEGDVKVIDFGIAKAADKSARTVAGVIKGKFSYMAPEQIDGRAVDPRSDIFALGIVLYEILSGERLYDGTNLFSIYEKVTKQPAPRVADSMDVAPELDDIVARCLQHDPEARFESAAQLADALAPFRIEERNIVGRREAQRFMRDVFPDDEAAMQARLQRYFAITNMHCVEPSREVDPRELARTQVFLSKDLPSFIRRDTGQTAPREIHTEVVKREDPTIPTEKQAVLRPTEMTPAKPPRPILGFTLVAIAIIAAAVILVARARGMTAMELYADLTKAKPAAAGGASGSPAENITPETATRPAKELAKDPAKSSNATSAPGPAKRKNTKLFPRAKRRAPADTQAVDEEDVH